MSRAHATATDESDNIPFSYDETPYESYSYRETHPDQLYVIGRLFGMNPPDFRTARVLELGCAAGGNLFPYAISFPGSKCVGIDLSVEEIKNALRIKSETGIGNIDFLHKDIMDINKNFGTFDYIIAHGVFSWVPDFVRDRVLQLCRDNLSENGIAMISYNAYPGWHSVNALREIMRYHSQDVSDPREKVRLARSLLDFLSQNAVKNQEHFIKCIDRERETLAHTHETYMYHDHLADINNPYYLHQFNDLLVKNGLQYVGDTSLPTMSTKNLEAAATAQLSKIKDPVRQEQYIDFLVNRRFRMSLVTHAGVKINRMLDAERIFEFYLTSNVTPMGSNMDPGQETVFQKKKGKYQFRSKDPIITASLLALCAAGRRAISVSELAQTVQEKLGLSGTEPVMQMLRNRGLDFVFADFIRLQPAPENFVTEVSEKPVAYILIRQEVKDNPERRKLTTATRHTGMTNKFSNILLGYCNGENDLNVLTEKMLTHVKNGDVTLIDHETMKPMGSESVTQDRVGKLVRDMLKKFAQGAMLVG